MISPSTGLHGGDDFPMIMEVEIDPNTGTRRANCPPVSVSFGLAPMRDSKQSRLAGHDVYIDVEHVKIVFPGDKNSLYFQPALDQHRQRFPTAYDAFKNRAQTPRTGLPLEQWPPITRALALTMKSAHIHTVEELAQVSDANIGKLGFNAREFRGKAQAYLATAKDGAAANALAEDKAKLERTIEGLQAQIIELASLVPKQSQVAAAPMPDTTADVEQEVVAAVRRPRIRKAG